MLVAGVLCVQRCLNFYLPVPLMHIRAVPAVLATDSCILRSLRCGIIVQLVWAALWPKENMAGIFCQVLFACIYYTVGRWCSIQ